MVGEGWSARKHRAVLGACNAARGMVGPGTSATNDFNKDALRVTLASPRIVLRLRIHSESFGIRFVTFGKLKKSERARFRLRRRSTGPSAASAREAQGFSGLH